MLQARLASNRRDTVRNWNMRESVPSRSVSRPDIQVPPVMEALRFPARRHTATYPTRSNARPSPLQQKRGEYLTELQGSAPSYVRTIRYSIRGENLRGAGGPGSWGI